VLTSGDRRAYVRQAKAQRSKGFQRVHVTFDQQPEPEAAPSAPASPAPASPAPVIPDPVEPGPAGTGS
jgi:membrane protein